MNSDVSHIVPDLPKSPFPGLRSYNRYEDAIFFGRDGHVGQMVRRLARTRFLCITGPSGCGKSSLARTGLFSGLLAGRVDGAGNKWLVVDTHPGNDPLGNLAVSLAQALLADPGAGENKLQGFDETSLSLQIRKSLGDHRNSLSKILGNLDALEGRSVLFLFDQFEELFNFANGTTGDALRYVELILDEIDGGHLPGPDATADGMEDDTGAAGEGGITRGVFSAITIRADALEKCSGYEGLAEAINRSQFLTPALSREELGAIIRGPISMYGGKIDDRFTSWLLNEMESERDRLPLLQHVMRALWDDEIERIEAQTNDTDVPVLNKADFKRNFPKALQNAVRSGDALRGSISVRLDDVYGEADPDLKLIIRAMFCALVDLSGAEQDRRRALTIAELAEITEASEADIIRAVEHFRAPGRVYLSPNSNDVPELDSDSLIFVTHECLLRKWTTLRDDWLRDDRNCGQQVWFLAQSAKACAKEEGTPFSYPQVEAFKRQFKHRSLNPAWAERFLRELHWSENGKRLAPGEVFERALRFLKDSERAVLEDRERKRREWKTKVWTRAATGVVVVAALMTILVMRNQRQEDQIVNLLLEAQIAELLGDGTSPTTTTSDGSGKQGAQQDCMDGAGGDCTTPGKDRTSFTTFFGEAVVNSNPDVLIAALTAQSQNVEVPQETVVIVPPPEPEGLIATALDMNVVSKRTLGPALEGLQISNWNPSADIEVCDPPKKHFEREGNPAGTVPFVGTVIADFDRPEAERAFEDGRSAMDKVGYETALRLFEQTHKLQNNVPRLYRYLGWSLHGLGREGEAWSCFSTALELSYELKDPAERDEQLLWSYGNLAIVPTSNGRPDIAAAAMAQRGLIYDRGSAYSEEELETRLRHTLRKAESFLQAAQGFRMAGDCGNGETSKAPEVFCPSATRYFRNSFDGYRAMGAHYTRIGATISNFEKRLFNDAVWEFSVEEAFTGLEGFDALTEQFTTQMQGLVEGDKPDPSFFLTYSNLLCQSGKPDEARALIKDWPADSKHLSRVNVALSCLESE